MNNLAENIKIPGHKDEKVDVLQLVQSWLNDPSKGKWVLVLDNVDDTEFLAAKSPHSGRRLVDYLPACSHGILAVTSRNLEVARGLVDEDGIIMLPPMTRPDSLKLLDARVGQPSNYEQAAQLVAALEYMPLAIAQAGSFIKKRAPRYSIQDYLTELGRSDKSRTRLLSADLRELRRDGEARNSILSTWQISFEQILRDRPSAADLLSVMSFYDCQGIPGFLMYAARRAFEADANTEDCGGQCFSDSRDNMFIVACTSDGGFNHECDSDFEADIDTLRGYALISVAPETQSFTIHRLIQFATREWLKSTHRDRLFAARSVCSLDATFPRAEYGGWERCQILYPHARSALTTRQESKEAQLKWASVACKTGWFLLRKGSLPEAERFITESLDLGTKALGPESDQMMMSKNALAAVCGAQGRYATAEMLSRSVLETQERIFGKSHSSSLECATNLAGTLLAQGKVDEASNLYRAGIERSGKDDDPAFIDSVHGLGLVLEDQGDYEGAEELQRRALEARERTLGRDHSSTLWSVAKLASLLGARGKYEEAGELSHRALKTRERILGKEHPDMLRSLSIIARKLRSQGKYEEAETIARRALNGFEKIFGKDHRHFFTCSFELGSIMFAQANHTAAEQMYRVALDWLERHSCDEDPDALAVRFHLAWCLQEVGRYHEALGLMQPCVEISRKVFWPEHPRTKLREELKDDLEGLVAWN